MLVLGINFGFHDPSAALIEDGRLLAMAEQERFSRRKRAREEMPIEAIRACLETAGASASDVESIGVGWDLRRFDPPLPRAAHRELGNALPPELRRLPGTPVTWVPHHLAHAASAFWSSGFKDAAVLVVDGQGERESTSIAAADAGGIRVLTSYPVNASLGHFYRAATQFAGLERPGSRGEGKLMGLAAYGQPRLPMPLVAGEHGFALMPETTVAHTAETRNEMRNVLRAWWTTKTFPYMDAKPDEQMAYAHFAASAQAALERALVCLAEEARRCSGSKRLVVAGGVAQNCSANAAIVESGIFEEHYFLPVVHDPGVSLGAGLYVCHAHAMATGDAFHPQRLDHAYWGPSFTDADVDSALSGRALRSARLSEAALVAGVARHLSNGRLVGWCCGRAEVGPRALGARSILADPRRREVVARLNRIKGREVWRPLAPSILAERFDAYFEGQLPSPFMNVRTIARREVWHRIPAVVHVDGSARPQAVDSRHAPRFWLLIHAFERLTDVPVLLNTSFNLAGEPIVSSPADAVRTFERSELDLLVLGDRLVWRPDDVPGLAAGS